MPERGENHDPRRGHATGSCRARDAVRYGLASEGCNKDRHHGSGETVAAIRNYIAAFLDTNLRGKPLDRLLTLSHAAFVSSLYCRLSFLGMLRPAGLCRFSRDLPALGCGHGLHAPFTTDPAATLPPHSSHDAGD